MSAHHMKAWQCEWRQALDGQWHTKCGETFTLATTVPDEDIRYCMHCGGYMYHLERTRFPHVRPSQRAVVAVADLFEVTG